MQEENLRKSDMAVDEVDMETYHRIKRIEEEP